ncbi:hypothetical protein B0H14DRAFT_2612573 [Mycena olivaceomarginata]|nr:hypothetical protein B0H14DRAFT_2612573 [Mycena olivaceomarginata]
MSTTKTTQLDEVVDRHIQVLEQVEQLGGSAAFREDPTRFQTLINLVKDVPRMEQIVCEELKEAVTVGDVPNNVVVTVCNTVEGCNHPEIEAAAQAVSAADGHVELSKAAGDLSKAVEQLPPLTQDEVHQRALEVLETCEQCGGSANSREMVQSLVIRYQAYVV